MSLLFIFGGLMVVQSCSVGYAIQATRKVETREPDLVFRLKAPG